MKSGRQRRTEIMLRRKAKQAIMQVKQLSARYDTPTYWLLAQTGATVPVDPANLRPNNSYGVPDFVQRGFYVEKPFSCKFCGAPHVWTAKQQHWWYEIAKGDVWTIAVACRPCRIKERVRKELARKVHFEGFQNKIKKIAEFKSFQSRGNK